MKCTTRMLARISLAAAVAPLGGCASLPAPCVRASVEGPLVMRADANMAQGHAVAIDLVFVQDASVAAMLAGMTARNYFASREQLGRDFPRAYVSTHWELPPGAYFSAEALERPCGTVSTFIFADYPNEGAHRLSLAKVRGTLILRETDMQWAYAD